MTQEQLSLPVGAQLQIQATVPENAVRHVVHLIGYLPGNSIVVTTPVAGGRVQIVREGQRFNVRVLMGERVVGFVSQVIATAVKPYAHLHLQYPEEFEQIVVRKGSRVNAEIDVAVRNTTDENERESFHAAQIVDLSESGAKIASAVPLGVVDEMLHMRFVLMVGGSSEEITLLGDIRGVSERSMANGSEGEVMHYFGVQFRSVNRYQQLLLHAWVMTQAIEDNTKSRRY